MIDPAEFPQVPSSQAYGFPVYMEPVAFSGERICVAAVALDEQRNHEAVRIIHESTAHCMLGKYPGAKLINMVDAVVDSLKRHLDKGCSPEGWVPPITGVQIGDVIQAKVSNLTMMVRTVARNSAFLMNLQDFQLEDEVIEADSEWVNERWATQIKDVVADKQPTLLGYFGKRVQLKENALPTRFDYIGQRVAAQAGRILPGSQFSYSATKAKSKLWELHVLQEKEQQGIGPLETYSLIVYKPAQTDPAFSEKQIKRADTLFDELQEEGDEHRIRVVAFDSPLNAADWLIDREMVA